MGDDDAVAPLTLGLIESLVRAFEEGFSLVGRFFESGYADRDGDCSGEFTCPLPVQVLEALADFLGAYGGLWQRTFGKDDEKLFASVAAGKVVGAHTMKQSFGDQAEGLVAGGMAEGVVVALEVINVEHHDRQSAAAAEGTVDFAFERFLHVSAVEESGERVAGGLKPEGLMQVKVGNGEGDVFGDGGSHLLAAAEIVRRRRRGGLRGRIVVAKRKDSKGFAICDKRSED
jgi:hypothetical protein